MSGKRPKVICLCGSTRFYKAFRDFNKRFTLEGVIVLTIGCEYHNDAELGITDEQKVELDELHKRKIDLADEVFVLDVGGYIGSSTRSEIEYAESRGKPIRYLSKEFPGYVEPVDPMDAACACAYKNGDPCHWKGDGCERVAFVDPAELTETERYARIGRAVVEWVEVARTQLPERNVPEDRGYWAGTYDGRVDILDELQEVITKAREGKTDG